MMLIQTVNMPWRPETWQKNDVQVEMIPNVDGYYEFHIDAINWLLKEAGFEKIA